jgi:nitrate reductase assembly molybdenum cofactor insertion protein NarJ
MSLKPIVFDHLAGLYEYPAAQYAHRVAACREALDARLAGSGEPLRLLEQHCSGMDAGELEEMFTRTFDFDPARALEVGWHIYGEEYARGALLVRLRGELRRLGIEESSELPDHLTHVLILLGRLDGTDADELAGRYVLPALDKILEAVTGTDCPYEPLLRVTRETVAAEHPSATVGAPVQRRGKPPGWRNRLPILQGLPSPRSGG